MRFPVKVNADHFIGGLLFGCNSAADPRGLLEPVQTPSEFSRSVSSLRFGKAFKTTGAGRYPKTLEKLKGLLANSRPVVLDMGASDGSTSLDVMRSIPFQRYYMTDLNARVYYSRKGRWTYFFDEGGAVILAASGLFIIYNDSDAPGLARPLLKCFFSAANVPSPDAADSLDLINPLAKAVVDNCNVFFMRHDALSEWGREKAGLVILANILNRDYFSEDKLRTIILNARKALGRMGVIALIDNREREQASIISIDGSCATLVDRVGPGADSEFLAIQALDNPAVALPSGHTVCLDPS